MCNIGCNHVIRGHPLDCSRGCTTLNIQATKFVDTIVSGTPLASMGDLDDSTSGNEPLWRAQRPTLNSYPSSPTKHAPSPLVSLPTSPLNQFTRISIAKGKVTVNKGAAFKVAGGRSIARGRVARVARAHA